MEVEAHPLRLGPIVAFQAVVHYPVHGTFSSITIPLDHTYHSLDLRPLHFGHSMPELVGQIPPICGSSLSLSPVGWCWISSAPLGSSPLVIWYPPGGPSPPPVG